MTPCCWRGAAQLFAIGATCTHYNGPLAEGLMVGDTVHCPWHHARFSLRTGEVIAAPALGPVPCWRVEQRDGKAFVRQKSEPPAAAARRRRAQASSERIVIVVAARRASRRPRCCGAEGFSGSVTLLSNDDTAPYDRPNCSKDFLAGTAPEDWMPLRPPEFYQEQGIDLKLRTEVAAIDAKARQVALAGGGSVPFDKLLLATGAEPVRLDIPGADQKHVHVLRSLADSRAIIAGAKEAARGRDRRELIGLEVAAALRARESSHRGAGETAAGTRARPEYGDRPPCTRSMASYFISRDGRRHRRG